MSTSERDATCTTASRRADVLRTTRRLVTLGLVVAVATPVEARRPRPRPPFDDFELREPFKRRVDPCTRAKSWKLVSRCLTKQGQTLKVLHATTDVKLVSLAPPAGKFARLALYARNDSGWFKTNFYGATNESNELRAVSPFKTPTGVGLRVEIGTQARTTVALEQGTTATGWVRRVTSTVCLPNGWSCRSMMTACDVYVRGRALYTFHGEMVWHETLGVRIKGDTRSAGPTCMPPKSYLLD